MTAENNIFRLANDPAMPRAGDLLKDRYRIERPLGEGGFAAVFKAFDTTTGANVAIKILDPLMSRRQEFSQRFLREVETISALTHYNTIRVTDKGETSSGCLFLVMELLEGGSLDDLIEDKGPMPPFLVRSVATQVLRSLSEAHSKNIIHRDIKPANIFLVQMPGENDHVKVLDFGIAKSMDGGEEAALTSTGQVMCSPHYVAPERVVDHVTVPSSDIYSLGVSMIEMLEGKPPYTSDTPIQLVMKHARLDDPVPMLPSTAEGPLGAIIRKATAKDHRQRYQSALEMLQDLKALGTGAVPGNAHPAPAFIPAATSGAQPEQRSLMRFWPLLLLLLILIVAGALAYKLLQSDGDGESELATSTTPNELQTPGETPPASALEELDQLFGAPSETPYLIDSVPSGAVVHFGDKKIGSTPLRVEHEQVPAPPFELQLRLADGREVTRSIRSHAELKSLLLQFPTAQEAENATEPDDHQPASSQPVTNTPAEAPKPTTNTAPTTTRPSTSQEPEAPKPTQNTSAPKPTPTEPKPTPTEPATAPTRPTNPPEAPKPPEEEPRRSPLSSPLPDFGGSGGGSYFGN